MTNRQPEQPTPFEGWALRHVRVSEHRWLTTCWIITDQLWPCHIDHAEAARLRDGTRLVALDGNGRNTP